MLTRQHTQECLSLAHLQALAGRAGVKVVFGTSHDYGVDGYLRQLVLKQGKPRESGLQIDFQLKASILWEFRGNLVVYDLDVKNYNDLVSREEEYNPFILILLCLPRDDARWLRTNENAMTLEHCCYWYRPTGALTGNDSKKRVLIPRTNLITAENIGPLLLELRRAKIGV